MTNPDTPQFVHLHVHTPYSILEGAIKLPELVKACVNTGMPAVGIADTNTLGGTYEFSKTMAGAGVQPIIGSQINVRFREDFAAPLVLIAKDKTGWVNLMNIVSRARLNTESSETAISAGTVRNHADGLLCLSGGWQGPVDTLLRDGRIDDARNLAQALSKVFDDRLYFELQRYGQQGEEAILSYLLEFGADLNAPAVASVDAYYLKPEMREAHEALRCMANKEFLTDAKREWLPEGHHLRSPEEMQTLFSDLPEALSNTLDLAERLAFKVDKQKPCLPEFPGLEGRTEEQALDEEARKGLEERLAQITPVAPAEDYWKRLDYELTIIKKMQFPGYFLIVADFIQWAKDHDIPVGPGRGSGAGSLVAYALKITDLDPLRFGLLFERFLNPDRVSMPDFDIDFCQERRDEVINYMKERYGKERVAQIGTFGKLQARAVLRASGRVLGLAPGYVNRYVQLIPNNPAHPVTLRQALEMEDVLHEVKRAEAPIHKMFDIALQLEGLFSHTSTHAAGVVIANDGLLDTVPVLRDADGNVVTEYNMKSVEDIGLVKFDFLGLKTLDVIDQTLKLVEETEGLKMDFATMGDDDDETYQMLSDGEAYGVFQLESAGMKDAMLRIKPSCIEDLTALVSLYRPGPMDNIPIYADRKHGFQDVTYQHPMLGDILKETYGVLVYQEQVMKLAQELAGYSLGQADLLRRAMGKKIASEMEAQREVFVQGAQAGWVEVETDDGRFVRLHSKLPVRTTDGKTVSLDEAVSQNLDVIL